MVVVVVPRLIAVTHLAFHHKLIASGRALSLLPVRYSSVATRSTGYKVAGNRVGN